MHEFVPHVYAWVNVSCICMSSCLMYMHELMFHVYVQLVISGLFTYHSYLKFALNNYNLLELCSGLYYWNYNINLKHWGVDQLIHLECVWLFRTGSSDRHFGHSDRQVGQASETFRQATWTGIWDIWTGNLDRYLEHLDRQLGQASGTFGQAAWTGIWDIQTGNLDRHLTTIRQQNIKIY